MGECPNTHNAACGFVQIRVRHKKALHLPLSERNAFRMQLMWHRFLTQMRTNDRIEIQKGHCLAVAPITSEISPPGFGRRKAGFSLLSFHRYNQHGEHYEKCKKFVGLHTNLPLSRGQDSTALSTVLAYSIAQEHTYDKKIPLMHTASRGFSYALKYPDSARGAHSPR